MKTTMTFDPRTVARDIPGVLDTVFPQLTPGIVAYLNRSHQTLPCTPVPLEKIESSSLRRAMLFEIGFSASEDLIVNSKINWNECIDRAKSRQSKYYDSEIPNHISDIDINISKNIGLNIFQMLKFIAEKEGFPIATNPYIPGFEWIASGNGDFSIGTTLVEVKCISKNFGSSDYKQMLMYWILSFLASIENNGTEWAKGILLNPRTGIAVSFEFDDLLRIVSAGSNKIEVLQRFVSMVGSRSAR